MGNSGKTMLSRYLSSFFPPDRVTDLRIHELEGQYELNSAPVLYRPSERGDLGRKIRKFLYENYEVCFIGETYAADVHTLYCRLYGEVSYNSFVKSRAAQQFGAWVVRRRHDGEGGPVSGLTGMRLRVMP